MKITKLLLIFISTFIIMSITNMGEVDTATTLVPLTRDGSFVYHYNSSDKVMIPENYTQKDEEFRGVWVATVYNLDMPTYSSETQYKADFDNLINEVLEANMNVIVFQVRPQNDAFYDSEYAPWSRWVTGTEGVDPGVDIMQYMIDTCHDNGIEFHAWLNPYRIANSTSSKSTVLNALHSENFAKQNPELVIAGNKDSNDRYPYILNPGEPEVKTYIRDVIKELMEIYNIDGIHFDDYFYPYSGIDSDTATYNTYKEEGQTIEDWRRENVNDVIKGVKEDVDTYNLANSDNVKFGISPSGVWKSGLPDGSNTSTSAGQSYTSQYADSKRWVEEGWLDYICPQIYRNFTHSLVPYADIVDWWVSVVRGTDVDLIIGHALYLDWDSGEVKDQLRYNQQHPEIAGSMMYRENYLDDPLMVEVINDYWTTMPTSIWPSSNIDSPNINISGTKVGDVYTSNATVTLTATDDIFYKIGSGDWIPYTTPLVFTSGNNVVYAKAVNSSLEESTVTSVNINIDKINIDIPVITVTGDKVGDNYAIDSVLTISSDSTPIWVAINHGSVGEWNLYTEEIILDDDGGYYIRAKTIDSEGTESDEAIVSVTVQSPCYDNPNHNITGVGTYPVYQNATVTLIGDSPTILYKINEGSWTTYSAPLMFDSEGIYTIQYLNDDNCGTVLSETIYIDQTVPLDPTSNITGGFDGRYYTEPVSVEFLTDDSENIIMYRLHNGSTWSEWQEYTEILNILYNSTYTVEYYTVDKALNESEIMSDRIRVNIPANEHTLFVVRNGQFVNYYGTTTHIPLPDNYIEKNEEIRAVWVATVGNIDIALHTSEQDYKNKLIFMLDTVEKNNFNTIFFQVRPMNDAFYPSEYAPFSRYLTGIEGVDPGWDILSFLIEEAHARGIEVHAWLNPYRVSTSTASKEAQLALLSDDNFAKQHPELVIVDNAGKLILNPGERQVRSYITNVIRELIANYDIDGIHFDDYFYSYNGTPDSEDQDAYNKTKLPGQTIDDWRRENINMIIEDVHEAILLHNSINNKNVKFGISPFGIWMSGGEGSNTSSYALQSYKDQYADSKKWVEEGWLDYVLPQLYWEFDHSAAPYADLVDWWASLCEENNVGLIIGHGFYRYDNDSWDDDNELLEQIRYADQYDSVIGSAFFSFRTLLSLDDEVVQAIERLNNYYWTTYPSFPWISNVEKQTDPVCLIDQTLINGECVDNNTDPVCLVDQTLIAGECIDNLPTCSINETLVNGECVLNAPVCDTGYELIDNACVLIETPQMDPVVKTVVIIGTAGASLGGIAIFIRKFFF